MATSRAHVTALPRGFIIVRVLQLLFTFLNIGLISFLVTQDSINTLSQIILLAITLLYLITSTWVILATYKYPRAYNYWAVLAMELFWLGLWAYCVLLSIAGRVRRDNACRYVTSTNEPLSDPGCPPDFNYSPVQAAAKCSLVVLGVTGALFVLQFASMIVVSEFIRRHRRAGGPCSPRSDDYMVEAPATGHQLAGVYA